MLDAQFSTRRIFKAECSMLNFQQEEYSTINAGCSILNKKNIQELMLDFNF
jgi:hypothetical protein